jgi:GH24 family phage-related lysozyme (muramidase)
MERPKGAFVTTKRVVRRSISPQSGGEKLKIQLARRRENEAAWLFEM